MPDLKRTSYVGSIVFSIVLSMHVGQDSAIRPHSLIYFAVVLPALVVPLIWWRGLAAAALGIGWLIAVRASRRWMAACDGRLPCRDPAFPVHLGSAVGMRA